MYLPPNKLLFLLIGWALTISFMIFMFVHQWPTKLPSVKYDMVFGLEPSATPANPISKIHRHNTVRPKSSDVLKFVKAPKTSKGRKEDGRQLSIKYCNSLDEIAQGSEGDPPSDNYQLVHVHVLLRHGARTAIYTLPNMSRADIPCNDYNLSDSHAAAYLRQVKNLGASSRHYYYSISPNDTVCRQSALTPMGALQHFTNGLFLKRRYRNLRQSQLESVWTPNGGQLVYVRSTQYSRTVQSALAFIMGFLDEPIQAEWFEFHVDSVSTRMCSQKLANVSCYCPTLTMLARVQSMQRKKYSSDSTLYKEIKKQVAKLLHVSSRTLPWVGAMLDALTSQICQRRPLPCVQGRCVTWDLVKQMWLFEHEAGYAEIHNTVHDKMARFEAYPLLVEICKRLMNVTTGETSNRVTVYSGHDQTLYPALMSLGIGQSFVAFASRLVIELYRESTVSVQQYFVKVLYNGIDRTEDIAFCSPLKDSLCPLSTFLDHYFHEEPSYFGENGYEGSCQK